MLLTGGCTCILDCGSWYGVFLDLLMRLQKTVMPVMLVFIFEDMHNSCYTGLFFRLKSAFSRSSVNLVGHNSSRNCTPLMSRRQPAPPAIVLNDGSPGPSVENSPNLHRSTSPIDLRKKVLLSQSGQLRSNTSNKSLNLMANQVKIVFNVKR